MNLWKKIAAAVKRQLARFESEARRRARWERRIQIEALESEIAELGRQLELWKRNEQRLARRRGNGVRLTDSERDLLQVVLRNIEVLSRQRSELMSALAALKGVR
jgi:hypothetical protein